MDVSLHEAAGYTVDPDTQKALFAIYEALNNIEVFVNLSLASESKETLDRLNKTLDDIEQKIRKLKATLL